MGFAGPASDSWDKLPKEVQESYKEKVDASKEGKKQKSHITKHKKRAASGQAPKASNSNSAKPGKANQKEEVDDKV